MLIFKDIKTVWDGSKYIMYGLTFDGAVYKSGLNDNDVLERSSIDFKSIQENEIEP